MNGTKDTGYSEITIKVHTWRCCEICVYNVCIMLGSAQHIPSLGRRIVRTFTDTE